MLTHGGALVTQPERLKGAKDEVKRHEEPPTRSWGPVGPLTSGIEWKNDLIIFWQNDTIYSEFWWFSRWFFQSSASIIIKLKHIIFEGGAPEEHIGAIKDIMDALHQPCYTARTKTPTKPERTLGNETIFVSFVIWDIINCTAQFFSSLPPSWLSKQVVRNKSKCLGFNQFQRTPGEQVMKCQRGHNMKISPGWTSRPTRTSLGRKLLLKIENKIYGGNVDNQLMRSKYWKTLLVQKLIGSLLAGKAN